MLKFVRRVRCCLCTRPQVASFYTILGVMRPVWPVEEVSAVSVTAPADHVLIF